MIPKIKPLKQAKPDQTLIYLLGKDCKLPDIELSVSEIEYVERSIANSKDIVVVNSYNKLSIFVREKPDIQAFAQFEYLRREGVKVVAELKKHKQSEATFVSYNACNGALDSLVEGVVLASYSFEKYKTAGNDGNKSDKYKLKLINIVGVDKDTIYKFKALTEAVFFARDMVNEPLNHLSAQGFSKLISEFCGSAGLSVTTLKRKQIEALKMGGLIAVNKGSNDPPTFSIIEWSPDKALNKKPIILIGKGVVFDTGGLNLKPTNSIEEMKADMAGAAAVAATMYYIAKRNLPLNIKALIPATDNRPGQDAYAPGDVITMYNGLSVEVLNTDAEGRLILADALSYAEKFTPSLVITMATLTGSAQMAFGNKGIATMGNASEQIFEVLNKSGDLSYERIARMPFWDEYGELLESDIADLKNIGGREAGAITAGKFLENFCKAPFIHLDIAGTAMIRAKDFYQPKGGTGSGVRLLSVFLEKLAEGNFDELE